MAPQPPAAALQALQATVRVKVTGKFEQPPCSGLVCSLAAQPVPPTTDTTGTTGTTGLWPYQIHHNDVVSNNAFVSLCFKCPFLDRRARCSLLTASFFPTFTHHVKSSYPPQGSGTKSFARCVSSYPRAFSDTQQGGATGVAKTTKLQTYV